jgi:hypothetical protein
MESPVRQIFQVPELELPEVLTAEPNDPTTREYKRSGKVLENIRHN